MDLHFSCFLCTLGVGFQGRRASDRLDSSAMEFPLMLIKC